MENLDRERIRKRNTMGKVGERGREERKKWRERTNDHSHNQFSEDSSFQPMACEESILQKFPFTPFYLPPEDLLRIVGYRYRKSTIRQKKMSKGCRDLQKFI